jgi:broad specificity phosphatase PhoE
MSSKRITLIRHAQSKFNAGQFQTNDELRNCRLTNHGINQCSTLNQSFDLLIISPLKRVMETYVNSNIKTKKIMISDLFRERKENHCLNFLENEEIVPESDEEVRERARKAIAYLKTFNVNNIGIISHACFIWYFLEQYQNRPENMANAQSITIEM